MSDWVIMMIILILGGITEFIALGYIKNQEKRRVVSITLWLVIAAILIIIWYIR